MNKQEGPPFIKGLLAAKNILAELKEKKLREVKSGERLTGAKDNIYVSANRSEQQTPVIQNSCQLMPIDETQRKGAVLRQNMNQIGAALHANYLQNQSLEVVFIKLSQYYGSQQPLVQENQRLKRRNYYLQEQIAQYQCKIQSNNATIDRYQHQTHHIRKLFTESTSDWLRGETEKQDISILKKLPNRKVQSYEWHEQNEENKVQAISLNWKNLSQMLKRPVIRKAKAQQEDIRSSLYSSELSTI